MYIYKWDLAFAYLFFIGAHCAGQIRDKPYWGVPIRIGEYRTIMAELEPDSGFCPSALWCSKTSFQATVAYSPVANVKINYSKIVHFGLQA